MFVEFKTKGGQTILVRARSVMKARGEAHYIAKTKYKDLLETGYKIVKQSAAEPPPKGHEMVRMICLANEMITERMNEVEASYIRYWEDRREYWMGKTEQEIDKMFPNRYISHDYYHSTYYQLRSEGGLSTNPYYYEKWQEKVRKDAKKAKETSINNLIHAIVKIARNEPITFFKVYNLKKGKAGLEGMVTVNETTKRLFAIYAEGPIQRLHIRYLIK